jgi:predicted Zn-dependent protease
LQALLPFLAAYDQGDPAWAMQAFARLPESLREKPLLARRHLQVVLERPTQRGLVFPILESYLEDYPADPAARLWSIDLYIEADDPRRAEQAIEHLDACLGGDPYLDFLRAELAFTREDYEAMETLTRAGLTAFPNSYFGNMLLLTALAVREKHAEAVKVLEKLERLYGAEETDAVLRTVDLGAFPESEVYRQWEERNR